MKYQESKYEVDSLAKTKSWLDAHGVKKKAEIITEHYYANRPDNDATKLVVYSDRCEIHILKESSGRFSLIENLRVADMQEGLRWLKTHGYKSVSVIRMKNTDYEYQGGIVGLYTINDLLFSVILDFPEPKLGRIERELGLDTALKVAIPYNKLLEQRGKLKVMPL